MKELKIKITGGGTQQDVAIELMTIAQLILSTPLEKMDGAEWEHPALMTEISLDEEIDIAIPPTYDDLVNAIIEIIKNPDEVDPIGYARDLIVKIDPALAPPLSNEE